MNKKNMLLAVISVGLLTSPMMAQAQGDYDYELVDHPGGTATQIFGINDRGDVSGNGFDNVASYPFVYTSKKGKFTDIAPLAGADTSVLGIDDAGILVGSADGSAHIRDKKGNYTTFSHPDAATFTQARGVNNKGLVAGFRDDASVITVGFIYDPKSDIFTDIIPDSFFTLAQGINSKGDVVGHGFFTGSSDPCTGILDPTFGRRYGFLRKADGTVNYFQVNGLRTSARGINDSGTVVGFVQDITAGTAKGVVVELDGTQCQSITIAAGDLLEIAGFDSLFAGSINNSGVIAGAVRNDILVDQHGFIARPE